MEEQQRVRQGLTALGEDPFTPRSGADIKPIQQTVPKKYRLRIGEFRIIYSIEKERSWLLKYSGEGVVTHYNQFNHPCPSACIIEIVEL